MTAASMLTGLKLPGGWEVVKALTHQPSSGGMHSAPYLVKDSSGKEHFLKAFDFSGAFEPGKDVIRELSFLTSAYEHERDILELCKARRLSAVVIAVTHGYIQVPGLSPQEGTVYYLIFELADGDVRRQVDVSKRLDFVWCTKILDHVTLGLMQVHREAIAHQDVKPSNVLVYGPNNSCRIADFGRSSRRGRQIWVDDLAIAGDRSYAPPELLYSYCDPDFAARRFGCDLYLLGNLASFLFSGVNVTSGIFSRLDSQFHPRNWGGTYEQVLPEIRRAFDDSIVDIAGQIDPIIRADIVPIISELCDPDLRRRGHPRIIGKPGQYSLERYKSRFDLISKTASVRARLRNTA